MAYSTIDKAKVVCAPYIYTGSGSSGTITDVGFTPDMYWHKNTTNNQGQGIIDTSRGNGNYISPNTTNAQLSDVGNYGITSGGFTFPNGDSFFNGSGNKMASWNWTAGGSSPTQTYTVKVVSDSGNKFRFDDFGSSAVTLALQEGGTYTFDASDSSNGSHPFVLGTSSGTDGSYSTGVTYKLDGVVKTYSQYTSGYSSASSRQLIITVAASAPTLYYNCSIHSGMGGQIDTNSNYGSSNFSGNKQSTVSASQLAGFSIVKYDGSGTSSTIGHGLNSAPQMIWVKRTTGSDSWTCGHTAMGWGKFVRLDITGAEASNTNTWTNTAPTSSVFSVNHDDTNNNGQSFVAYCFANVSGFQRMGLYRGNESSDNQFVYTGFKPSIIIIKNIHGTNNWMIFDDKRLGYNPDNNVLHPNTNDAEQTDDEIDIVSNGFKLRLSNQETGHNGHRYLYYAVGQTLVGSNNVPVTAR